VSLSASPYGPNNEHLPERLQGALRRIVQQFSTESAFSRRQEIRRIVGDLVKTPPWTNEMHEYPYLQWNTEAHSAQPRAAYPHAADKIGRSVATSARQYERLAHLAQSQGGPLTEGGDDNPNLITFQPT
jgi:hypothetical protein